MSDMPVYIIVNLAVTDANEYCCHEKGSFGFLEKCSGEFVTDDDRPITFEGDAPRVSRVIVPVFALKGDPVSGLAKLGDEIIARL